jgi:hypothetical protein
LHLQHLLHDFLTSLANLLYFFIGAGFEHGDTKGSRFDVLALLRQRVRSKGKWTDGLRLCDAGCRALPGGELPLGVVTGLIGATLFIALVLRLHRA